jgi:drug/metabolite transporter (DMT)-like permease
MEIRSRQIFTETSLMTSDAAKTSFLTQRSHILRGFILCVLAVFFWGSSAPIGKYLIVTRFDTLIIAQTRTSLTFLLLLFYFLFKNQNVFRIQPPDIWKFGFLGVVGISLTNYTYYFTATESSVATAILVQYTAPVWVVLYSVFILKEEKLDRMTIVSLLFGLIGCYFAVTAGSIDRINLKGWTIITGPLSAFTFAYQIVATKQLLKRYSVWTMLLYMFGFSTLFWLCINPPWNILAKNYSTSDWGIFWMFAVVSILIPQTAFASGLKLLDASKVGIISILEPVIAILAAFLILGESLTLIQVFGAVLVVVAIGLLQAHPHLVQSVLWKSFFSVKEV